MFSQKGRAGPNKSALVVALTISLLMTACGTASATVTSNSSKKETVVIDFDVTKSLTKQFRLGARDAVAAALPRLAHGNHGPIDIYVRKIDHSSGSDEAGVAEYQISGVHGCAGSNPFDQACRNAHNGSVRAARAQARRIAAKIRRLDLPRAKAGTVIRGALAAAGEILSEEDGMKFLVIASDLRPSHASPPRPHVALDGVHVIVLFSCRQPIAICQQRHTSWTAELSHDGAASVRFLEAQQMTELFRG
jgi:hypothetical protein